MNFALDVQTKNQNMHLNALHLRWEWDKKWNFLCRCISFSFIFMFYLMIILVVCKNSEIRTLYIPWLCKFLINISRGSLLSVWIWKVFRQVPSDQFHYLNCCCGLTIWWTTGFPRGGFWQENQSTVLCFYKSITGYFRA